ncbi:oligosaccharide flippase family protein [Candidatus Peregrinibacteria bacterium]|nr:oligosaccharide flippase family protein [Candidatus Peregrinibacteria bacterium]
MLKKIKKEFKQSSNFLTFMGIKSAGLVILALIPMILAGVLGPQSFGSYSLCMMIVFFFSTLLIRSPQSPFIVYGAKEYNKTGKINLAFSGRLILFALGVLIFFIVSFLCSDLILKFTSINKVQFWFLLSAFFGLSFQILIHNIFFILDKRKTAVGYNLLTSTVSAIIILFLYRYLTLKLEYVFLIWLVAPVISGIFMIRNIDFKKLIPFELDKALLNKMLNYTKWVMIGGTAVYFVNWGDNLVLRYFTSISEIGVYNLGYSIFKGISTLSGAVTMYFFTSVARAIDNPKKIKIYLYNRRPRIIAFSIICISALFISLPYIFNFIYGEEYMGSSLTAQVLLLASLFAIYWSMYGPIFSSLERYRFIQISHIFFVLLNLSLDVVFVKHYGYIGAAIATTISYAVMGVIYEFYFRKYCKAQLSA